MKRHIAINGRDETSFHELMPQFSDRPIVDGGSRCDFIALRRRCIASSDSSDFHPAVVIKLKTHRL